MKLFLRIVGDGSSGQEIRIMKNFLSCFFQVMLRNIRALNIKDNTYKYM